MKRQLTTLVIQELKQAMRNRSLIFMFVVFPLFMWGLQGGIQFIAITNTVSEGETFYVINQDTGNSTTNLGNLLIQSLDGYTKVNSSPIYGAVLNTTLHADTYEQAISLVKNKGFSPLIYIPQNFTSVYDGFSESSNSSPPSIFLLSRPDDDALFVNDLSIALQSIVTSPPFTKVTYHKLTSVVPEKIVFEGEEEESFFFLGLIAFIATLIAVQAPASYISTAFSGEREKHTLEALLALPMKRIHILLGKVIAAFILTLIFAISNIFGMLIFAKLVDAENILTTYQIVIVTLVLVITAFVATGLGISITSFAKDTRTANTVYQFVMLIPTVFVGFSAIFGTVPDTLDWVYIIPWMHTIAVLQKALFPQILSNSTLTGNIALDITFHLAYLFFFVMVSFILAARLFSRESILKS